MTTILTPLLYVNQTRKNEVAPLRSWKHGYLATAQGTRPNQETDSTGEELIRTIVN